MPKRGEATRFEYAIRAEVLEPWPASQGQLHIAWSRGEKRKGRCEDVVGEPLSDVSQRFSFMSEIRLPATLYKDSSGKGRTDAASFLKKKPITLYVMGEASGARAGRGAVQLGSVVLNLSDFCNTEGSVQTLAIPVACGREIAQAVGNPMLRLSIACRMMQRTGSMSKGAGSSAQLSSGAGSQLSAGGSSQRRGFLGLGKKTGHRRGNSRFGSTADSSHVADFLGDTVQSGSTAAAPPVEGGYDSDGILIDSDDEDAMAGALTFQSTARLAQQEAEQKAQQQRAARLAEERAQQEAAAAALLADGDSSGSDDGGGAQHAADRAALFGSAARPRSARQPAAKQGSGGGLAAMAEAFTVTRSASNASAGSAGPSRQGSGGRGEGGFAQASSPTKADGSARASLGTAAAAAAGGRPPRTPRTERSRMNSGLTADNIAREVILEGRPYEHGAEPADGRGGTALLGNAVQRTRSGRMPMQTLEEDETGEAGGSSRAGDAAEASSGRPSGEQGPPAAAAPARDRAGASRGGVAGPPRGLGLGNLQATPLGAPADGGDGAAARAAAMRQARIKKMAAWRSKASSRLSSRNSEVASQSGGHAAEQQSASHRSSSQAGGHVQGGERLHVDTAATAGDDASTPLWDRSGTPGESRGTARETDLPLTTPSETTGLTRGRHTPGTPSDANFGGATSGLSPDNADSGRHDGASQLSPTGGSTSLHKWGSQHGRGSSKASAEDPVSPPGVFTQASLAAWGDQGLGVRAAAAHAPEPTPQEELRSLPEPSKAESPAAAAPAVRASLGTRIDAWIDAALFVAAPRSAAASRPLCAPEAAARLLLHAVATAHAPAAAAAQVVAALRARAGLAGADLPALVWVYVVAVRVRQGLPFAASGAGNGAAALKVERECFSALAAALFAQTLRVHADTDAPWVSRVEGWGAALRGAQTTLRRACAAVLPAAQSTAEAARLARPIQLVLLRLVDAVLLNTTLALPVPGSLSAGSGSAVAAAVRDAALACSGRDLHPDYQAAASKLPELPKDGALTFGWGMESKMGLSTVLEAVGADPAAGNSVLPLMRSVADLLMVPKDLLADPSTRREVCPHLTTDQVAAVLERYHPDCYCADPVDPGILDAIIAPRTGGDGGAVELRRIIEDVAYDAPGADADAAPAWLAGGQRAVDTDVGVLLRAGGGVCGAHGTPAKDVLRAVQAPDDGPAKEEPPPRTAPAIGPRPVRRRAPPVADSAGAGNGAAAAGAAAGPTEERAWWRGVGARGRAAAQRRQQGAGAGGGGDGFSFAQGDAAQVAVDLT